ncbi:MAG TPA: molybdenum cofactor biosynthesis protein MoaE [Myxococcaceae bacterium]|nr:molybdenum cofactor biosynthesis protein MoaE [Myxococcaceae bacterium]
MTDADADVRPARVLLFGAARDRAGAAFLQLPMPTAGVTLERFWALLIAHTPELEPLVPYLRLAVDRELVGRDTQVLPTAELAVLPPVSGGSGGSPFRVQEQPLSLDAVVAAVQHAGAGAVVTFTGAVRNATSGRRVVRLEYEAYAAMADAVLLRIGHEVENGWPGARLAIHHRIGVLEPGELAVVIAASAPHRAAAFESCRHAIERLKQEVPIWKKECFEDGSTWVGLGP